MGKTRATKASDVAALEQHLSAAKGLAFVRFTGLKVKEAMDLRRRCRAAGVTYVVAKKTILKIVLEQAGIHNVNPRTIPGELAVAFSFDDEVTAAQVIGEFATQHPAVQFTGGFSAAPEGWRLLSAVEVVALSKIAGRPELLAGLVRTMAGPVRALVGVLSATLRSLPQVLRAIERQRA